VAHGETAVEGIPDAELVILGDCGHMPMVEQRGAFNAEVRAFLASS
jgi:pimeloyl-ACP methyl ester carboxylesterase